MSGMPSHAGVTASDGQIFLDARLDASQPASQSGITRVSGDGGMTCGPGEVPNFLVERHSRQKLCTLFFGGSAQVYRATRYRLPTSARFSSLQPVISQPL